MPRQLAVITSWEQFQERWKNTASEAEAIGLLHDLRKVLPGGMRTPDDVRLFCEQVAFLLDVPQEEGEGDVADNAMQVFATVSFLGDVSVAVNVSPEDAFSTYYKVLAFLSTGAGCLKHPPYPERIQRSLYRLWHIWREVVSQISLPVREGVVEKVWPRSYMDPLPLLFAMSVWGAADLIMAPLLPGVRKDTLSRKREAQLLLPAMEGILDTLFGNTKERVLLASLSEAKKGNRTPRDLSDEDERALCKRIAGRALLRCRQAAQMNE